MTTIYFAPGLKPVLKHQEHDQSTHGNWADGSQGSVSELSDSDIQDILQNTKTVEGMYQKVAERLGKTLKPKVEVIPEGKENLYRGMSNLERDAEKLVNGKIPFTPLQTWGQGIYATPDKQEAGSYGQVVRMKLDSKAKIVTGEPEPFFVDTTGTSFKSDFIDFPKLLPKIKSGEMDNFSISDAYNIYHAAKGYDGYQPHGGEIVLFNGTHLTVNRTDIGTAVQKHQEHDQTTHGNWATGARGSDITNDCKSYFGTDVMSYQTSEAKIEIQKRSDAARIVGKGHENYILEIVAEKQGFDGKPKVVSSDEIDQLEKDGWAIAYRGITDFSVDGAVKFKAENLAEELRTGNYHAGAGTDGDGLYFTSDKVVAKSYAGIKGIVVRVAIPPNSVLTPDVFHAEIKNHREKINKGGVGDFWGADDIGVSLASKGIRGAQSLRGMSIPKGGSSYRIAPVFVIWDRSMLAVEKAKSK